MRSPEYFEQQVDHSLRPAEEAEEPAHDAGGRVWVIAADMGYGHLRAAYPFRKLGIGGIRILGVNDGTAPLERKLWKKLLAVYSAFSRVRGWPYIGKYLFNILDAFLRIPSFYPMRNLSRSTFQVHLLDYLIEKGLCAGMLRTIRELPSPVLTSFYAPAIAAARAHCEPVYCIICDADLNRVWVAREPWESRIVYFAPCGRAAQRLRAYGVPPERIIVTGYPLPEELLGGEDLHILKADLGQRLRHLDAEGRFWRLHSKNVEHFLGQELCTPRHDRILTLTYVVGGAGAQKDIGRRITIGLQDALGRRMIRLRLVAGTHAGIRDYFEEARLLLEDEAARNVEIVYAASVEEYFQQFNALLRDTDILWTKPSELSFYCALGLPVIMSPPIGSQEYFNSKWLREVRAGIKQEDPDFVGDWLFDFLRRGQLAEAAWSGFLNARKLGTYKIRAVVMKGAVLPDDSPLLR